MKKWLLVPVLGMLAGCDGAANKSSPIQYEKHSSFIALGDKGEQALQHFEQACPTFAKYAPDFEKLKVSAIPTMLVNPPGIHWRNRVEISFKVKGRPVNRELIEGRSFGHNCWIEMGGGMEPGFHIIKHGCAAVCDLTDRTYDAYYFKAVPEMVALEPKEGAQIAEMRRITEGGPKLKKLELQALKGNFDARKQLAYEYESGTGIAPLDFVLACTWRTVILYSEATELTGMDKTMFDVTCGKLSDEEKEKAYLGYLVATGLEKD